MHSFEEQIRVNFKRWHIKSDKLHSELSGINTNLLINTDSIYLYTRCNTVNVRNIFKTSLLQWIIFWYSAIYLEKTENTDNKRDAELVICSKQFLKLNINVLNALLFSKIYMLKRINVHVKFKCKQYCCSRKEKIARTMF